MCFDEAATVLRQQNYTFSLTYRVSRKKFFYLIYFWELAQLLNFSMSLGWENGNIAGHLVLFCHFKTVLVAY